MPRCFCAPAAAIDEWIAAMFNTLFLTCRRQMLRVHSVFAGALFLEIAIGR